MLRFCKALLVVSLLALIGACSSNVQMGHSSTYAYAGEKYGKVVVVLADSVSNDKDKAYRAEDLTLDRHIAAALKASNLLDETSLNSVRVTINAIRVRNTFNAVMFGFMSGSDNIDGTVQLFDEQQKSRASFNVKASYSLGGIAGGQSDTRLGWLRDKFAELTVNTILGKPETK
jgi:Domain of unknown function (DUF4410)